MGTADAEKPRDWRKRREGVGGSPSRPAHRPALPPPPSHRQLVQQRSLAAPIVAGVVAKAGKDEDTWRADRRRLDPRRRVRAKGDDDGAWAGRRHGRHERGGASAPASLPAGSDRAHAAPLSRRCPSASGSPASGARCARGAVARPAGREAEPPPAPTRRRRRPPCPILQNLPFYRLFIADSRAPRDGRHIEVVGHYDPAPGGRRDQEGRRAAAAPASAHTLLVPPQPRTATSTSA